MNRFEARLKSVPVGGSFPLTAQSIGMDAEGFHQLLSTWISNGGGEGFSVSGEKHETQTGRRLWDRIMVTRTAE